MIPHIHDYRLHEELRHSIEAQMNAVRHGGSGSLPSLEKEMLENVQHQLDLLTKVAVIHGSVLLVNFVLN